MMTKQRALLRARMLLGKNATVSMGKSPGKDNSGDHYDEYRVGVREGLAGMAFNLIRGSGKSWEEALDEAERYVRGVGVTLLSEELEIIVEAVGLPRFDGDKGNPSERALHARLLTLLKRARKRDGIPRG